MKTIEDLRKELLDLNCKIEDVYGENNSESICPFSLDIHESRKFGETDTCSMCSIQMMRLQVGDEIEFVNGKCEDTDYNYAMSEVYAELNAKAKGWQQVREKILDADKPKENPKVPALFSRLSEVLTEIQNGMKTFSRHCEELADLPREDIETGYKWVPIPSSTFGDRVSPVKIGDIVKCLDDTNPLATEWVNPILKRGSVHMVTNSDHSRNVIEIARCGNQEFLQYDFALLVKIEPNVKAETAFIWVKITPENISLVKLYDEVKFISNAISHISYGEIRRVSSVNGVRIGIFSEKNEMFDMSFFARRLWFDKTINN